MSVSVIVPTWCEAPTIAEAVESLAWADEVLVADADSPDGTARHARAAGARIVRSEKGRGAQLRAGAEQARGEVLLFLHADARLEPGAREAMLDALADPDVVGGNFRLRFVPRSPVADLFSAVDQARRRCLRIYYGDSGIFVRRDVYRRLGGFRPLPIFEDYDFARRLERLGRTAHVRDVAVSVSARRFRGRVAGTIWTWFVLQLAFSAGVPASRLVGRYPDIRHDALQPDR